MYANDIQPMQVELPSYKGGIVKGILDSQVIHSHMYIPVRRDMMLGFCSSSAEVLLHTACGIPK